MQKFSLGSVKGTTSLTKEEDTIRDNNRISEKKNRRSGAQDSGDQSPTLVNGQRVSNRSPDRNKSRESEIGVIDYEAMQLSLIQQQNQAGLKQLDKTTNSASAIVAGLPTADSPNSTRGDSAKESGSENPLAAAMAAAAAAAGVPTSGLPFSPASLLGSQQIQQLLSQQVPSPGQLQAFMQQHQAIAAQQQQAQQLQELYRQQQKQIHDFQLQITRQQGKHSSNQNDVNNNNNTNEESKFGSDTQSQLQQQIALQQLVQLQQMQAQHQQHQQAAVLHQQQGLAAAAAAAFAQGRQLPPLTSPELQQIWKQMAESAALQAAFVAASSGAKGRNGTNEQCESSSREKIFSSPHDERKLADVNGELSRRRSRESSPDINSTPSINLVSSLFSHGVCKWPGCDLECSDTSEFRRHLNQDHRLDDKSTAQCRVQMQVVEQLEKQLNQERERLSAMMTHLHSMEDSLRDVQNHQDRDSGRSQDGDDHSRSSDRPAPPLIKPDLSLITGSHSLKQAGAHLMGPMFNSVAGSVLNAAAGSSLSLPSSPNGFNSSMLPGSMSHSPPSMASHFQSSSSMNSIGGRDASNIMQQQSSRRRHSNAMPISAELSQNQEFYKNADVRPPYTYASLIRQAIIETPDHQLTLNEIYNWFQRKFAYFRRNTATWKNAVRHNLSLHKCFVRVENVKGAVWTVDENEYQKRRPQKFSGSPIMRGREQPCYYNNPLNTSLQQIALGESAFNPALLASQAQAVMLGAPAFGKLSQQSGTTVNEVNSTRGRKRSPSPNSHRYSEEMAAMAKVKRERSDYAAMCEKSRGTVGSTSPATSAHEKSVEERNASNDGAKYGQEREAYSPDSRSPESAATSRTSPGLAALSNHLGRHPQASTEENSASHDVTRQAHPDSEASGESDNGLEEGDKMHRNPPVLQARGSFTMLHEQPSD